MLNLSGLLILLRLKIILMVY